MHHKTRLLPLLLALLMFCAPLLAEADAGSYSDHPLLTWKDRGPCRALLGTIRVKVVFVSVGDDSWTLGGIADRKQALQDSFSLLKRSATSYGVTLQFSVQYHNTTASVEPSITNNNEWVDQVLQGIPAYRNRTGTEWVNGPVIFVCTSNGRAFAHQTAAQDRLEYVVSFHDDSSHVLAHEILHLFGMRDYYMEPRIKAAAQRIFPDSIMLSAENGDSVDPLTAYVIGWTSRLDRDSLQLLEETASVTESDYEQARTANQVSGFGTINRTNSEYTGMLLDGIPDEWGREDRNSGDVYLGTFESGKRHGQGVYTWANGEMYIGEFDSNDRTGYGVYYWTDGDAYLGDFIAGERTGKGIYHWPDGDTYLGDFIAGERTGQGIYRWPNGNYYAGDFVADKRTGTGSYFWPDGSYYIGDFVSGKRTGTGTLTWPDGSSYTGEFVDNAITGQGVCIWPDGRIYTGGFLNGKFHGAGMMIYPDGRVRQGIWENGSYQSGN